MMLMAAFCMESDVFSKQRWLILVGVLGLSAACTQVQEPQSVLTQGQEESVQCPAAMAVGQTVTVQLEANLTTGYRWILVPPTEALQVKETEAVALYQDGRVGAPVLQTWQIQAQQAVSTDLRWLYVRPWQTDEVAKAVTCHIVAK